MDDPHSVLSLNTTLCTLPEHSAPEQQHIDSTHYTRNNVTFQSAHKGSVYFSEMLNTHTVELSFEMNVFFHA